MLFRSQAELPDHLDLASATDLAVKMVREFGLSKTLGPVGYPEGGSAFLGSNGQQFASRPFAEATQAEIDTEVSRMLREAEARAVKLLKEHRAQLDQLAALLQEQETVDGSDVYRIAGRPDRSATVPPMPAITPMGSPRAAATAAATAPATADAKTAATDAHIAPSAASRPDHD